MSEEYWIVCVRGVEGLFFPKLVSEPVYSLLYYNFPLFLFHSFSWGDNEGVFSNFFRVHSFVVLRPCYFACQFCLILKCVPVRDVVQIICLNS